MLASYLIAGWVTASIPTAAVVAVFLRGAAYRAAWAAGRSTVA